MTNLLHVNPEAPTAPEGLEAPAAGAGEVVVLLADEGSHRRGWARLAAVEIARAWSGAGVRVVLADGDLDGAGLHELVGAANGEGVADMVLFGSSPARVSRPVEGERFLFVPAGTAVADPVAVFAHPRFPAIVSHYRESGCALLLYLPEEGTGSAEAAGAGDRTIRFASFPPEGEPGPDSVVVVAKSPAVDAPAVESPAAEPMSLEFAAAEELTGAEPGEEAPEEEEFGALPALELDATPEFDAGPEPGEEAREEGEFGALPPLELDATPEFEALPPLDFDPTPGFEAPPELEPVEFEPPQLEAAPELDTAPEAEAVPEVEAIPELAEVAPPRAEVPAEPPSPPVEARPRPAARTPAPLPLIEAPARRLPARTLYLLLILLGVILGALGLGWLGYIEIPGLLSIVNYTG